MIMLRAPVSTLAVLISPNRQIQYYILKIKVRQNLKNSGEKMKLFVLLLIGITILTDSVSLRSSITSRDLNVYADPYIVRSNKTGQPYLLAFFYDDNFGYFKIYTRDDLEVFSKTINTRAMYMFTCFFDNNYFYFFSDKLFIFDIDNMNLDSVSLRRKDYISVNILGTKGRKILAAKSSEEMDLYNIPDYIKIKSFKSDYGKPDLASMINNIFIYRNVENELTGYDLKKNCIKWKLNTGKASANLWGIKIGKFNNFITSYKIVKNREESYFYVTTAIGDLYKLDPLSGKVLVKKEHFRGDDNNSGLITDLQYADINGDGIKDLIGPAVDHNIYCLNGKDLSVIWQYDTGNENQIPTTLSDINNDGIPEIFNINDGMTLTILDGKNGKCITNYQIDDEKNQARPIVGYFYDNEHRDIIVKAKNREIRIYELKTF